MPKAMIGNAYVMIYYMCLHVYLLASARFVVVEWFHWG